MDFGLFLVLRDPRIPVPRKKMEIRSGKCEVCWFNPLGWSVSGIHASVYEFKYAIVRI